MVYFTVKIYYHFCVVHKQPFSIQHEHSRYQYNGQFSTWNNTIISKIHKKKVTEDSIYLNNKVENNIDNKSVIEILKRLQCKGLINQLYRPIGKAIASKVPHSTTSQSVISPIAENGE